MQSGESEKTTIASEEDAHDPVQQFIHDNIQDERQVELFKGYKSYEKWADKWILPVTISLFTLLLLIGAAVTYLSEIPAETITVPATYLFSAIIGVTLAIGITSQVAQYLNELNSEKIAYHELASSFESYRNNNDNIEPVCDRISTSLDYMTKSNFNRIDKQRLNECKRYLRKVDETDKNEYIEEEFHDTFPRFMVEFSNGVASPTETELSRIAKDMDSVYTGETPMTNRLREDIGRLVRFLFTGSELIITGPLIILSTLTYFSIIEISSAIGIFGVIFAAYAYYENR